jgi:DNA repair exonuclease SbcCD ATPase subunit
MLRKSVHCRMLGTVATCSALVLANLAVSQVFGQPAPSLDDLKQRLQSEQQRLQTAKAAYTADHNRHRLDQQSVRSLTGALNTAQAVLNRAMQNSPKKWRCNAYGNLHDDPRECSNQGAGGVWITQRSADADDAQADVDRIKQSLDDKRRGFKGLKAQCNQEYQQWKAGEKQLQSDLEQYRSQVRQLPANKTEIDRIDQAANANSTDCDWRQLEFPVDDN